MSTSFKRIPVKDMPKQQFYRQIVIVVVIGLALIAAAGAYAIWLNSWTGLRAAQQRAVHVQMAASRIGEQYYGLGKSLYETGATSGQLNAEAQEAVLGAAHETGTVALYGFDCAQMQATSLVYNDGRYTVSYDAAESSPWTVTSDLFPQVTKTY